MAGAVGLVLAGALAGTARADEWDQIAALQRIKASLTPAERKLDSRLAVELKQGKTSGTREVDIRGEVSVAKLRDLGAVIRAASRHSVRAAVPIDKLEAIAKWPGVKRVDESVGAITAVIRPPGWTPGKPGQELRRRAAPVISEGDAAHAADIARSQARVSGVGVKVCALSDGVDSLADAQAAGELPPDVDVLPDQDNAAKDLGVFNIAAALPSSMAPAIAPAILAIGHGSYSVLYAFAGTCAIIGGAAILPVKRVR